MIKKTGKQRLITAASAAALSIALSTASVAQAQNKVEFDIAEQPLSTALLEYSDATGAVVMAPAELTRGKRAPAVRGDLEPSEALSRILNGSGLKYQQADNGVFTVTLARASLGEGSTEARPFRVAALAQEEGVTTITLDDEEDADEDEREDVIVVTGTNIRGIAPESSPARTFSREDIQITGAATAQDFIQTLPSNFGGGAQDDIVAGIPGDGTGFGNTSEGGFGSSVNLRGLGSGSTLVLLNGRRVAPASGLGEFVDISMIPASAIERVEVLTDGASSIYGADAVAGVVNFVLRSDYDGAEVSLRHGTVTSGNRDEYRAAVTGGKNWSSGHAMLSYEFLSQTNLSVADRTFSQSGPLPNDLLPSQRRHSVLASASQEVTQGIELFADAIFSERDAVQNRRSLTVPPQRNERSTRNWNVTAGATWLASDSWVVDIAGSYGTVSIDVGTFLIPETGDNQQKIDSRIWTAEAKASGPIFTLPAGDLKLAIGGQYRAEDFENIRLDGRNRIADRNVYAVFGEVFVPVIGPDNDIPGIERLEISVSGRFDDFTDFGSTTNPKVGLLWSPADALRLRGTYSTSFTPPSLGLVGQGRTGSVFPTTFINQIFGLTPPDPSLADVSLLAVGGSAAEDLDAEKSRAFTGGIDFDQQWARDNFSLSITYFDIKFEDRLGQTPVPGGVGVFAGTNIAFENPELFPDGSVIFNPSADLVDQSIDQIVNDAFSPLFIFPGASVEDIEIINNLALLRNLASTFVRGLDFSASYQHETDAGNYTLGLDGTFLRNFKQQGASTTPAVELLNTQFNPVDLKLRGRVGYSHDGFSANIFVNYTDDYRIDNSPDSAAIDSWTTVDVSISFDTQEKFNIGALNNAVARLSVINLFDKNPPATPGSPGNSIFGFDPANASPLNRFIAFELTKRF